MVTAYVRFRHEILNSFVTGRHRFSPGAAAVVVQRECELCIRRTTTRSGVFPVAASNLESMRHRRSHHGSEESKRVTHAWFSRQQLSGIDVRPVLLSAYKLLRIRMQWLDI